MSLANPIPRSTRQNDVAAATGQTVFGPFDWKVYAAEDVAVKSRAAAAASYSDVDASAYTVALSDPANLPSFFTVTFATAPRPGADAVSVRIAGARVDERSTDVTQAGVIRSVALEKQLDVTTMVMQELRRDIDEAIAPGALDTAVAAAAAAGTAAAQQAATDAETALASAQTLTDGLQESVDSTLAQVNSVLTQATTAKNDAQSAAAQTTEDRAATGADVTTAAGYATACAGYADALANPDYGFFTEAVAETRDYGSFA